MNVRSTIPGIAGFLISFWCFRNFAHDVAAPLWLWVALGIAVLYVSTLTYILLEVIERLRVANEMNKSLTRDVREHRVLH